MPNFDHRAVVFIHYELIVIFTEYIVNGLLSCWNIMMFVFFTLCRLECLLILEQIIAFRSLYFAKKCISLPSVNCKDTCIVMVIEY